MLRTRLRPQSPGVEVIDVEGELDLTYTAELRRLLMTRLSGGLRHLVVNLQGLKFMDSSGLAVFVVAATRARALDCRFSLVVATPRIADLLQIAGMRAGDHYFASEAEVLEEARTA